MNGDEIRSYSIVSWMNSSIWLVMFASFFFFFFSSLVDSSLVFVTLQNKITEHLVGFVFDGVLGYEVGKV